MKNLTATEIQMRQAAYNEQVNRNIARASKKFSRQSGKLALRMGDGLGILPTSVVCGIQLTINE